MEYVKAISSDEEQIFDLVQRTIKSVYPKYYPKEVVDFFCELHSRENIAGDIASGAVGVLRNENEIVGTGSYQDNHITRVYVARASKAGIWQLYNAVLGKRDFIELRYCLSGCITSGKPNV